MHSSSSASISTEPAEGPSALHCKPSLASGSVWHTLSISSTWSSIHNGMEGFDELEKSKRQKYSGMVGNNEQKYTVFEMSTFGRWPKHL